MDWSTVVQLYSACKKFDWDLMTKTGLRWKDGKILHENNNIWNYNGTNKETRDLNNTTNKLDLKDTCRTPRKTECIFFPSTYGKISRIDHVLGHKIIF
jgi:hypothetical protein